MFRLGAFALADAIECLPNLEILNLGDCLVRTDGALKLATALSTCKKIRKVNVEFGEIRLPGAQALIKALPLDSLEELALNGNKFGDDGIETLQAMCSLGRFN